MMILQSYSSKWMIPRPVGSIGSGAPCRARPWDERLAVCCGGGGGCCCGCPVPIRCDRPASIRPPFDRAPTVAAAAACCYGGSRRDSSGTCGVPSRPPWRHGRIRWTEARPASRVLPYHCRWGFRHRVGGPATARQTRDLAVDWSRASAWRRSLMDDTEGDVCWLRSAAVVYPTLAASLL